MKNIVKNKDSSDLQQKLKTILIRKLAERGDKFLKGQDYMNLWNYKWNENDIPD